jgi:hypothetical protein
MVLISQSGISQMDYSIEVSENGNYLRVVTEVDVTVEMAREWVSRVVELGLEKGISKYLFDVRKGKNISDIAENYNFSYNDIPHLNVDRASRHVILVDPKDHSHDFIETTMMNAGFNVKIFFEESEAAKWFED